MHLNVYIKKVFEWCKTDYFAYFWNICNIFGVALTIEIYDDSEYYRHNSQSF